ANNLFFNATNATSNVSVDIEHEVDGLLVAGNRIEHTDSTTQSIAILLRDCTGVVSGNVVHAMDGAIAGLYIQDSGPMIPWTDLTVSNNVFTTSGDGIAVFHNGKTNSFILALVNNTLAGSQVGLRLVGNNAGGGKDYGTITSSGNDFRGSYAGMGSHAIWAFDNTNTSTINAQGNLFSVADPQTVVSAANAPGTT